jgi:anti-sigma regulatory factor (Ser/Thr protein kinase)
MKKNKQLIIRNQINELNRVVAFLETLEEEWELPVALIPAINLALEEALTNVIFYAYEKDTDNGIGINFEIDGTQLTMVITDSGVPYDPTLKNDPDITLSVDDRPVGGLGIFLIRKIMDEVLYQRNGNFNQLTMVKTW